LLTGSTPGIYENALKHVLRFQWKTEPNHESLTCFHCVSSPSLSEGFSWFRLDHVQTVWHTGTRRQPERRRDEMSIQVHRHSHSPCQSTRPDYTFIRQIHTNVSIFTKHIAMITSATFGTGSFSTTICLFDSIITQKVTEECSWN